MLVIRAISFKGGPVARQLAATFEEAGGTIGRGENATLVLPDPERFISRTHATISFQAGGFIVTDNGTKNATLLNGRPLGQGCQARVGDGDQITIGDYVLEATLARRDARQVGDLTDLEPARASDSPKDDPLAVLGLPAPTAADPFADLLGGVDREAPGAGASGGPRIPTDFAIDFGASPSPGVTPSDPLAGIRPKDPSLDELFDLKSPSGADPLLDPSLLGGRSTPQGAGGGGVIDPLDILQGTVKPIPPPSAPDYGPELFTPYAPPPPRPDAAEEAAGHGDVPRSEGPSTSAARRDVPPAPSMVPPSAAPPSVERVAPASTPLEPSPPAVAGERRAADAAGAAASGSVEDLLLRAFIRGAGIPETHLPKGLTPDTMEMLGRLMREAVQGTLDLLRARGLTKSEMRADVTTIMPVDNNPLKFSPTAEAALVHLLAPRLPGFMPPLQAMKDAYDDLRAHQLGFLAGMRAALDEVLARFAPEQLEQRLSDSTVLDALLPMNRKGKLWQLFVERYRDVASEAREDFNAVFGKAFVRAYEAQVKRLRAEPRA
jgi:FHA domain-containing protein